jgi:hypothetical protein
VGGWGKNIVKNGDFKDTDCNSLFCIWNTGSLNADSALNPVKYWIQSPEIEVGKGYIYNRKFGDQYVTELDPK